MCNFDKVIRWQSCLSLHHPVIVFMEWLAILVCLNPLNTKLNPICHLLALLGAHHILHISRIRVKKVRFLTCFVVLSTTVLKWHHNIAHSWAPCSIHNFTIGKTTWICIFRIILWVSHAEACLFSKEVYRNSNLSYSHTNIYIIFHIYLSYSWKKETNEQKYCEVFGSHSGDRETAVAQHLRCCATNRKVTGSIPDGVNVIFHWHNPSDRTMALGSTQPLTEMSTRSISWG